MKPATIGWFLFAILAGVVIYITSKTKPAAASGSPHSATVPPNSAPKPGPANTSNIAGTIPGAIATTGALASLISNLFPSSNTDVTTPTQIAQDDITAMGIGSGVVGNYPAMVDTNPLGGVSSIYDMGASIAPTLAPQDTNIADAIDAELASSVSIYS